MVCTIDIEILTTQKGAILLVFRTLTTWDLVSFISGIPSHIFRINFSNVFASEKWRHDIDLILI